MCVRCRACKCVHVQPAIFSDVLAVHVSAACRFVHVNHAHVRIMRLPFCMWCAHALGVPVVPCSMCTLSELAWPWSSTNALVHAVSALPDLRPPLVYPSLVLPLVYSWSTLGPPLVHHWSTLGLPSAPHGLSFGMPLVALLLLAPQECKVKFGTLAAASAFR